MYVGRGGKGVAEGDLQRTNPSENCLATGNTLGMALSTFPSIRTMPIMLNDPGEMIEAAEDKVDSVSHFVWVCLGENDSYAQQHCSQGGLSVRVQVGWTTWEGG